ncbi:MAG TPA: Hsp20/alpha crystallin family protein [Limnochordia bacterium]
MEITPWEPWESMRQWAERFNRLLPDSLLRGDGRQWQPRVDIAETDTEVIVRADLPGVEPENIDVRVQGQSLTLKGEVEQTTESEERGYHQIERRWGSFFRQLSLPAPVDPDSAQASYRNGVLEIRMQKERRAVGRRLEIQRH